MNLYRRSLLSGFVLAAALLAGCGTVVPTPAPDFAARTVLAPTGKLRVGVYAGSPTSLVVDPKTGLKVGVAHDLGQKLASELGVPFELVEFRRVAEVIDALKIGRVDFTFTNATAVRAKDVDFTPPLLTVELGYLVPPGSTIANVSDIDRPGVRVGVSEGSSSQGTLSKQYKSATIIPAPSLKRAGEMLMSRQLDAFATNKAVLFELTDAVPGARVIDGRWGEEHMAIAIPKGRDAGMPYLRKFAVETKASGLFKSIVEKSGVRGAMSAN